MPGEPRTEAGKRLHDWLGWHPIDGRDEYIRAIEDEAHAQAAAAFGWAEVNLPDIPDEPAAPASSAGLDVERLRQAFDRASHFGMATILPTPDAVAREYAALATSTEEPKE